MFRKKKKYEITIEIVGLRYIHSRLERISSLNVKRVASIFIKHFRLACPINNHVTGTRVTLGFYSEDLVLTDTFWTDITTEELQLVVHRAVTDACNEVEFVDRPCWI